MPFFAGKANVAQLAQSVAARLPQMRNDLARFLAVRATAAWADPGNTVGGLLDPVSPTLRGRPFGGVLGVGGTLAFGPGLAQSIIGATSPLTLAAGLAAKRRNPLVTLFTGQGAGSIGSSGTDWGGIVSTIGNGVLGIFQAKEQNKMLKRLNRAMYGGRSLMAPGLVANPALGSGFAPALGVPAATAGGGQLGSVLATLGLGGLGLGLSTAGIGDMLPGGLEESGTGLFGPDLFKPGAQSQRQRMIDAVHPTTGERVYWRPVGRPIMFTGDAALLKRSRKMVRKLSSNAGCGVAARTFRRRRR